MLYRSVFALAQNGSTRQEYGKNRYIV